MSLLATRARTCPGWCAGDHRCTARLPAGEHQSLPQTWRVGVARLVVTRHRSLSGRQHMEVRMVLRLPYEEDAAAAMSERVAAAAVSLLSTRRR
jgi:hypothetical protein